MNKKDKLIITVLVVIISCFCLYKIADATSYTYVKTKAQFYLSQKYDAKMTDFEVIDYRRAGIYWDDHNIFWLTPNWVDFCFEFEYNNRYVMVNRFNGKFYDDYQLDDIESWCTQWLQQNVDKRIVGVRLDSTHIFWYLYNTDKSHNYILTQDDTVEFLNNYSFNGAEENFNEFFYYDKENEQQSEDEITSKIKSKINLYGISYSSYISTYIEKQNIKSQYKPWNNCFSVATDINKTN